MSELWSGVPYESFLAAALACRTRAEFERSAFFARHGDALVSFLSTPWIVPPEPAPPWGPREMFGAAVEAGLDGRRGAQLSSPTPGREDEAFRVVHWNIEKGLELERIVERLTRDSDLATADIYCLNEVDVGMARSGANGDVGAVLARELGCWRVFAPSFLECTKGPGTDAAAPGENARGIHGLAILSRHPVEEAHVAGLPHCWDYFDFHEKRYGGRQVLSARILWRDSPILVATTHLEVRNTPACRARQMEAVLAAVQAQRSTPIGLSADPRPGPSDRAAGDAGPSHGKLPAVLTGDFNTNTFRRGGRTRAAREFLRIVTTPREALAAELRAPFRREPLFARLESAGFAYLPFTDGAPTTEQVLGAAEDLDAVPAALRELLRRSFGFGSRRLRMRLDWIAAAGWSAAGPPRTASPEVSAGSPASDHAIVWVDLARA